MAAAILAGPPAAAQQWGNAPQPQQWGSTPQAQGLALTGAWTTTVMAAQGPITATLAFGQDGSYVLVDTQNGKFMRQWGRFSAKQTSATTAHIDFQINGYAPQQVCSQIVNGPHYCVPLPPSQITKFDVQFSSPTSFQAANGLDGMFQRDAQAQLLQAQVPATMVNYSQSSQGPVMPTLHPYQTPGGAGSVGAMRYDDEHQQPYRVCGVTGGMVYQTQDGVEHCSTQ